MAEGILYESAQVKLNASGNGTVQLGPLSARTIWHPAIAAVQVTTNTKEATCNIYVGSSATAPYLVDATFAGSSGDSTDRVAGRDVRVGNWVWAVWTGGDANAIATLTLNGTKDI